MLVADEPHLAAMYAIFGRLTKSEDANGIERIPARAEPAGPILACLLAVVHVVSRGFTSALQARDAPAVPPRLPGAYWSWRQI
jgi:hypothetical protein